MRTGADAIPAIGSRRELFVDDFLIGGLNGVRLKLHEPKPGGVAIRYDTPWEGYPDTPLSFFTTVLKDGDTYRMYYRGAYDPLMVNNCYAESVDGVSWSKPSKKNHTISGIYRPPVYVRTAQEVVGSANPDLDSSLRCAAFGMTFGGGRYVRNNHGRVEATQGDGIVPNHRDAAIYVIGGLDSGPVSEYGAGSTRE